MGTLDWGEGKLVYWREGERVFRDNDVELPARCIACNAPGHGRSLRCSLVATPRLSDVVAGFLVGPLLRLAAPSAERGRVWVFPCRRHRTIYVVRHVVGVLLLAAGMSAVAAGRLELPWGGSHLSDAGVVGLLLGVVLCLGQPGPVRLVGRRGAHLELSVPGGYLGHVPTQRTFVSRRKR